MALLAPSNDKDRSLIVRAANFTSLASVDKVGETTITKFLELNEDVLLRALGGVRLIPQPLLPWMEGNAYAEETSIQPDFLLVDSEGEAHICEVKLPLLGRTSLTTGGHKRRRFISGVAEGIAQLGNYKEYFSFSSHRQLVIERYDVLVGEPRLILLVGSAENYVEQEVLDAQRMLRRFELLDYDTVRAMFLVRSGYVPGHPLPPNDV